jgi:MFS family permease
MPAPFDQTPRDHMTTPTSLPAEAIRKSVRLSYAQAMLGAIFSASTGGMFITGFALRLGADNVLLGLMSTVPMLGVVVQLFSSSLVERGTSRRMLATLGSALNAGGWAIVIALPYVVGSAPPATRVGALIAVMALVSLFAQAAGNARASWLGDLIPPGERGGFFGKINMYAGLIGVAFAMAEGAFLDRVKNAGTAAFSWLFLLGMVAGLVSAALFIPQADVPMVRQGARKNQVRLIRDTLQNRPLLLVTLYAVVWSLQGIAGFFPAAYMLRDLGVPFLGVGLVNAVATLTVLLSSPLWGRIVDRYGSRPVLIACSLFVCPLPLVWLFVSSPRAVYALVGPLNLLGGFASAGVSVALTTLLFKVTEGSGRSLQLAVYSIVVTLLAAPMPAIGGHLVDWLGRLGIQADLRVTFYVGAPVALAAALVARRLREPEAHRTLELVRNLPRHLRRPSTLRRAG